MSQLLSLVIAFTSLTPLAFADAGGGNAYEVGSSEKKPESPSRVKLAWVEKKTLKDKTHSWGQPYESYAQGWDGRCGETAAANILAMCVKKTADSPETPEDVANLMSDPTPGTLPSTLRKFLNKYANPLDNVRWDIATPGARFALDALRSALTQKDVAVAENNNAPVIVLLLFPNRYLHWVTVVNVTETEDDETVVVYNQGSEDDNSGEQVTMNADDFLALWGFKYSTWSSAAYLRTCCSPYTMIKQSAN